jgi:hypothetical protein
METIRKSINVQPPVALTTDPTTTPTIEIGMFASGQIHIPTGSTITTLTYYSAAQTGDTFLPMQDAAGNAVTQTVAQTKSYPIPAIVFGAANIRITGNAAGAVSISLKS